jgi:hypothetical protein
MSVHVFSRPFRNTVRILWMSAVLLVILEATALACTLALAWVRGLEPADPVLLGSGVLCSLIIWLFVLIFHIKKETLLLPVRRRMDMLGKLRQGLADLGYEVSQPSRDRILGRPAFHSYLLGGTIQAHVDDTRAVVTGPKVSLERLHQRLRLNHLLDLTPLSPNRSATSGRAAFADRAQLHIRIPSQKGPDILRSLAAALKDRGIDATFDVTVSLRDEAGVNKAVLEGVLKQELKPAGVVFQKA